RTVARRSGHRRSRHPRRDPRALAAARRERLRGAQRGLNGMRPRLHCAAALLIACATAAAQSTPDPGEYESPNGDLSVKATAGSTSFEITTVGGNGHTCSLQGEIRSGKAQLEGNDGPCLVTFRAAEHGVEVSGNQECRYWCGMRATFEGTFLAADAPCASKPRAAVRKTFQRAYDRKDYAAARAALEPLLADCAQ